MFEIALMVAIIGAIVIYNLNDDLILKIGDNVL